jgi:cytochrome c551/c552
MRDLGVILLPTRDVPQQNLRESNAMRIWTRGSPPLPRPSRPGLFHTFACRLLCHAPKVRAAGPHLRLCAASFAVATNVSAHGLTAQRSSGSGAFSREKRHIPAACVMCRDRSVSSAESTQWVMSAGP